MFFGTALYRIGSSGQSIGSIVSDPIVRRWLWSSATWSFPTLGITSSSITSSSITSSSITSSSITSSSITSSSSTISILIKKVTMDGREELVAFESPTISLV